MNVGDAGRRGSEQKGRCVLLTTHRWARVVRRCAALTTRRSMDEAELLGDRVLLIARGQVRASGYASLVASFALFVAAFLR